MALPSELACVDTFCVSLDHNIIKRTCVFFYCALITYIIYINIYKYWVGALECGRFEVR